MANAGASIEAVLTLNATGFQQGITKSITALDKFVTSISKLKNTDGRLAIQNLTTALLEFDTVLRQVELMNKSAINTFSKLSSAVNKMANGLKLLQGDELNLIEAVNTMNSIFKAFQGVLEGTEVKVKELKIANDSLVASERQVASASAQESASIEKDAISKEKATTSTVKYTNANKSLSSSFSMLRNGITLVGSMIAYNFIHNLAMATTETINAKSEMMGYFQMWGIGKTQIADFNSELNKTVQMFPRLNKYALGETISSIGVEFELTTAEMKKAMPVVSMITSEYLRAGRNVNEASLAVKDILQGEFQRLSRETGVKGKQLEEAGWSGDKNDVMGLLEALDKVGKSRNWDKFVAKANSLNDAVLILQNRFSEWSADMVERVQPTILGVFNDLMVVGTSFGRVLNKALDWLSGDGIGQGIVKWGGLATAIGLVTTALIHYRTGANLVQIARMGILKSIGASILGLEAETVATMGLRNAIVLNTTGINAETLAKEFNISVRQARLSAIVSSILGLEAETVAENGLLTSVLATASGIEVEKFAVMELNEQLLVVAGSIGVVAGAMLILTAYFGSQAIAINNNIEKYNQFLDAINNGDTIINDAKDSFDSLTEKVKQLEEKKKGLTEGTYEYQMAVDELTVANNDLTTATKNYEDAVNGVAWARHKQELYDTEKESRALQTQREINQALIDYGVSVKEANEISSPILSNIQDGWEQHYETLQRVNLQQSKNATTVTHYLDELQKKNIDPKEVQLIIKPLIKSGNDIASAKEKLGNATSMTEYVDAWLWLQYKEIQHSITEFGVKSKLDWGEAIKGLFEGLGHGIDSLNLPIPSLTEWLFSDILHLDDYSLNLDTFPTLAISEALVNWLSSVDWDTEIKNIVDVAFGGINILGKIFDVILPPVSASDGSSDHPDVQTEIDQVVFQPIRDVLNDFIANPMAYLNFGGFSVVHLIENLFTVDVGGIQEWVQTHIIQPLIDAVTFGIENTPVLGDIAKLLGLGDDPESEAQSKGQSVGDSFNIGITDGLSGVGDIIHGAFEGLGIEDLTSQFMSNASNITSTATSTASDVASSFANMKNNQKSSLDSMVQKNNQSFSDMQVKSNEKMMAMRDSTSKTTQEMTTAWDSMRGSIVASARKIQEESAKRFNDLGVTIGGFYRKIQNPSLWGSAGGTGIRQGTPNRRVGRAVSRVLAPNGYSGGVNIPRKTMSVGALKQMICPTGDCDGIFKGYTSTDMINVNEFLSTIGDGHGFGWNFATSHNQFIKNKSDAWKMGSPIINLLGGIPTSASFKVGEFNNGTPKISWEAFQSMAQSIFSAIPYKLYYDSSWKGSWLGALQAGACNCYDGASALLAFANACGFSGHMAHGTWTNSDGQTFGHVWAVINGRKMDTTGWQNAGTWTPRQSAGGYVSGSSGGKTVNVTIDMSNSVIYGVDDLDNRIKQSTKEAIREEFNDPYTVAI